MGGLGFPSGQRGYIPTRSATSAIALLRTLVALKREPGSAETGQALSRTPNDQTLHRLVAEATSDLQTVVSPAGDYQFVSLAGSAEFGWLPGDLVGHPHASFTHPDDEALVLDCHRALLAGEAESLTTVHRFRCEDGSYRWTESRSRVDRSGEDPLVVVSTRDIADRRTAELHLQHLAATDPLTGVANRTVFMDRLRHALRRLDRHSGVIAVLFLDLDRFKLINDSLGHQTGDAVLLQMSERLLEVLRPQDTLARLGGDEFAIVVEDLASSEEAISLGGRPEALPGRRRAGGVHDEHRSGGDLRRRPQRRGSSSGS